MRHDHRRDGAVVLDQIALGDALVRPEHLVEVGELHARRLLREHLGGRLVVAEPEVHRRAQMTVVRPLRELHLRDELRLHPDHVRLSDLRHLRHDRQR